MPIPRVNRSININSIIIFFLLFFIYYFSLFIVIGEYGVIVLEFYFTVFLELYYYRARFITFVLGEVVCYGFTGGADIATAFIEIEVFSGVFYSFVFYFVYDYDV